MNDTHSLVVKTALRPRARLLRTMGEELISNEVVAIVELVKNAYDADANLVSIRFLEVTKGKGIIEVVDDGTGMGMYEFQRIWMEPATPSKRGPIRRTKKYNRRYLGEKGIGRFASSRLADELEVFSRPENSDTEIYGIVDWRQFDDENKYLDEVIILSEERVPTEFGSVTGKSTQLHSPLEPSFPPLKYGTKLRMRGTKQEWGSKQFEELRRILARLILRSPSDNLAQNFDPGFEVELILPEEFSRYSSRIEPPAIIRHPHYLITGKVLDDGFFNISHNILTEGVVQVASGRFIRVRDRRGDFRLRSIIQKDAEQLVLPNDSQPIICGPLQIELRIWDRDDLGNVVQQTSSTINDVRRDLDSMAGVSIYRDDFRIFPYGEPQDDWLRLDLRRVQNPTTRLSNNQIYGIIKISADANPLLKDQSNREGLNENQALQDLRDLVTEVLSQLEALRYKSRRRSPAENKPVGGLFAGVDLKPLSDYLAKQHPQDKNARQILDKAESDLNSQLKEIQTVLGRYQRLATLGQLIDHVLHDGVQPIATINSEADLGAQEIQKAKLSTDVLLPKLLNRFSVIQKQGRVLAGAFRRMEPFGGRRRGRPSSHCLEQIIKDSFAVFENIFETLRIKTHTPQTQTTVRVDPSEIQEVFVNLIQNSVYWLEQVSDSQREIAVSLESSRPDQIDILFSDSGPGVPSEHQDSIFDPYFSTKPDGVGLGLSITGEIIEDYYGGKLELLKTGKLAGANFLITLRKRI